MKKIIIIICILTLAISMTSCKGKALYDEENIDPLLINANNTFAFDIFKKLNAEDAQSNVFISPLSISTALSMTYNGAGGSTKKAMADTLGYSNSQMDALNSSYKNLIGYLNNVDKKVKLNIGNSIWINEGQQIKDAFIDTNKDNFNAQVDMLDFSKASSADTINKWIKDATSGKIDKMITPPIPSDVVMYLINAIYFKGEWTNQFERDQTFDAKFTDGSGLKQDIKMMNRKGKAEYARGNDYKAVRLPYGGGKTSMYCILPDESIGINEFAGSMDVEKWNEIKNGVKETDDLLLRIPRFGIEYGIKKLNDILISMGMGEAFDSSADFSGIREGLFISKVLHKAVIEVNEEGSEAAGATVVAMNESAPANPMEFIADRPFLFVISEDVTGSILFMGKMYNP